MRKQSLFTTILPSIQFILCFLNSSKSIAQINYPNSSAYHIQGNVIDGDNRPINNALVQLYLFDYYLINERTTDSMGNFSLTTDRYIVDLFGRRTLVIRISQPECNEKRINLTIQKRTLLPDIKLRTKPENYFRELNICIYCRCHTTLNLIDEYPHPTGQTFTSEQIEQMAH